MIVYYYSNMQSITTRNHTSRTVTISAIIDNINVIMKALCTRNVQQFFT